MSWLPLFADEQDAKRLISWLNAQNDLAYLLRQNATRWKAVRRVTHLDDGEYLLWHVASGALQSYAPQPNVKIANPWGGWDRPPPPNIRSLPPGTAYATPSKTPPVSSPGLFELALWTRYLPYSKQEKARLKTIDASWGGPNPFMHLSSFGFSNGESLKSAQQFWKRLHLWIAYEAIPLGDLIKEPEEEPWRFWAFPSALKRLKAGIDYYANGTNLDKEIQAAKLP